MKKIKVIANVTDNNLFCKTVKDNFDFLIFFTPYGNIKPFA